MRVRSTFMTPFLRPIAAIFSFTAAVSYVLASSHPRAWYVFGVFIVLSLGMFVWTALDRECWDNLRQALNESQGRKHYIVPDRRR